MFALYVVFCISAGTQSVPALLEVRRVMGSRKNRRRLSIIIPTFNGATRIGNCLEALLPQAARHAANVLVIDDGSVDQTAEVVKRYHNVRLIGQPNAGPAAARNRGAAEALGEVIVFIDDDCVPAPKWLDAMLQAFNDSDVVGAKGVYRTRQRNVIARFVQIEYEDRYRRMKKQRYIDFVDTYSAAFLRERFLETEGYDTSFPVACAEDAELSYRMSTRGWKMKFVPDAVVSHTHPDTVVGYLKKKYKFAYWRMLALRKTPKKGLKDSHTPQLMKLQLFFMPALLIGLAFDLTGRSLWPSAVVAAAFLISAMPFVIRAAIKDPLVGLVSPLLLVMRSSAQLLGVVAGLMYVRRCSQLEPRQSETRSAA